MKDKIINNKKVIIILSIIFIIILGLIIANNNQKEELTDIPEVDISQVFDIQDVSKSKYEIEKKKEIEISYEYLTGKGSYELLANVEFTGKTGKMYYIREYYESMNVYKTEYKIDEYEAISSQVEGIILDFEGKCKSYLGIDYEEKGSEELRGESITQSKIPLGESIYYENRLYVKTYSMEEKTYEMNFYKKDNKIICELVYKL